MGEMVDQTNKMVKRKTTISLLYLTSVLLLQSCAIAQPVQSVPNKIIVAAYGSGDYKTIQAAINSLPDSSATPRTIFIKKGTYSEKLFIEN